jgi:hypothetical protein
MAILFSSSSNLNPPIIVDTPAPWSESESIGRASRWWGHRVEPELLSASLRDLWSPAEQSLPAAR